ncbi:MAG: hypothetical protein AB1414_14090 [bacterium]
MKMILIDTQVLTFALKKIYIEVDNRELDLFIKAEELLRKTLDNERVLISGQLVVELYHVLTMRGRKIPRDHAVVLIKDLLEEKNVKYRDIQRNMITKAMELSAETGIHIWDFLVVLPFVNEIDTIYTTDPHFNNKKFTEYATIENPLRIWRTEGAK